MKLQASFGGLLPNPFEFALRLQLGRAVSSTMMQLTL